MVRARRSLVRRRSGLILLGSALAIACVSLTAAGCSSASPEDAQGSIGQAATSVPSYNVDTTQTTVSGLSSGAFMAVQFHVAFSASVSGAAVFAGGPYDCAQDSLVTALTACTSQTTTLDASPYISTTKQYASAGSIDPVSNLANAKVFLFGGKDDTTVQPVVMDSLSQYYAAFVTGSGSVTYESRHPGTAHTMPTVDYGINCDTTTSPYIGKCNYDGAGNALTKMYGALNAAATTLSGTFLTIPQSSFIASPSSHSLGDSAYAYIPKSCANGDTCRIHVAFHGCKQTIPDISDAFYKHAGYNEWADTNHVIVVYPQAIDTSGSNPNGCWDWWGYDSADYTKKSGPQMAMVKAMIDHLAGGLTPPVDGGAPKDAGGDVAVNDGAPSDAGKGTDASDAGGKDAAPPSDAGSPPKDSGSGGGASCYIASNAAHVAAGRAHVQFGLAVANGSYEYLGLPVDYVVTSLVSIGPNDWVIGFCP